MSTDTAHDHCFYERPEHITAIEDLGEVPTEGSLVVYLKSQITPAGSGIFRGRLNIKVLQ
jgi:hypothetical protein